MYSTLYDNVPVVWETVTKYYKKTADFAQQMECGKENAIVKKSASADLDLINQR